MYSRLLRLVVWNLCTC